jgi:nitroreductase
VDVFEAIRTRRSIRKYKDKPVEKEKLLKIIEAARLAPSTLNRQPWSFVVVTDSKVKEKLRSACNQNWFAPAIIVECAFPEKAWVRDDGEEYWKLDVAVAVQNLVLAAWEEGLGIEEARVLVMTALGYPAEKKGPVSNRKPLKEIVHYDHW